MGIGANIQATRQAAGLTQEQLAAEVGERGQAVIPKEARDPKSNYTPMNDAKANFCWWSVVTDVLHDSLTLCNWVWPMTASPAKARNYRGDFQLALRMVYGKFGGDGELGCPTRACLDEYDMPDVKAELDALGLLP